MTRIRSLPKSWPCYRAGPEGLLLQPAGMSTQAGNNIVALGSPAPILHTGLSGRPRDSPVAHGNQEPIGGQGSGAAMTMSSIPGVMERMKSGWGKGLHLCENHPTPLPHPNHQATGKAHLSLGQTTESGDTGQPCFRECSYERKGSLCIVSWWVSRYRPVREWISESLIDTSSTCEQVAGVRHCPNTGCVWAQRVGVHLCETKTQRVWRRTGCMCV